MSPVRAPQPQAKQQPVDPRKIVENQVKLSGFIARMTAENLKREEKKNQLEKKRLEDEIRELEEQRKNASRVYSQSFVKNYHRPIRPREERQTVQHSFQEQQSNSINESALVIDDSLCLNFKLDE